jgi:hypothetical protein
LRITGWLQYELQQRRVTGLDGDFVPCDVLNSLNPLFGQDVVRKVLEETGFNEPEASALAHRVLTDHLRWFAILVDIGIVDHIRSPFQIWIRDCHLPIARVQFLKFLEEFKSVIPQSSRSVGSIETNRWEKLASLFCLRQREYLSPILREGQHYDSKDGVMPFWLIENTFHNYNDQSILVYVDPAHHHFDPVYRGAQNVDGGYLGYLVALRSLPMDEL